MKPLLLSIMLTVLVVLDANTQVTFSISNGGISYSSGSAASNTFHGNLGISSLSGAITMEWEVIEVNVPQGWEVSNCDPLICHPIGVNSAQFSLTGSSTIHGHFYPNGQSGSGHMKLSFKNINDPNDQAEVIWYGYASGLSNEEIVSTQMLVYPIPARDLLNIKIANGVSNVTFGIYDITGKLVKSGNTSNPEQNVVFVGDLVRGVYILRFVSDEGMEISSKIVLE
ncbi:MAG: T9SS type A sorting domain-containing protein [Flavobacteriales bacterium]